MNTETSETGCLSQLLLDRWVAGEVAKDEQVAVMAHLRGCSRCAARQADREEEKRLFQTTAPPLVLGARRATGPTPAPVRPLSLRRAAGGVAVMVAALAAGFLIVPDLGRRPLHNPETVIAKGQQRLRLFLRDGVAGTVREGGPHEQVHPGDEIRFAFNSEALAGKRVAVLGRDASGKISVYFPDGGTQTSAPPAAADGLIPYSLRLDNTLGPETLYALYCTETVSLGPLQGALSVGAAPVWPAACQVEILLLDKKPRR